MPTTATLHTNHGDITVNLLPDHAPKTVANFVGLASGTKEYRDPVSGAPTTGNFYDGLTFHRVIQGFMAQGGDPEGTGAGGPGYTIEDEPPKAGEYKVGSVAMARTQAPNSAGSQFFIVTGDMGVGLEPHYALFGQVTDGMDAVTKIEADGTPGEGPPAKVHTIEKVTITEK